MTLDHLADLSDSSAVSVHVEAWTRLADAPNARRVRVHLQGKTTSRDPSSRLALRSDAVTVMHLLESDTTRTVARALAPSSNPAGFRRGQVGVDLSSTLGRGEAVGEVVPFPDVDAAFLADTDWTLEKPPKGDRKDAVEATMVLSEASWSDFQDLLAYLTVARMYDLDGDEDDGGNGAMLLEDLLRAFEFADGRHRTWGYSPFGAFPFAAGLLPLFLRDRGGTPGHRDRRRVAGVDRLVLRRGRQSPCGGRTSADRGDTERGASSRRRPSRRSSLQFRRLGCSW